MNRRLVISLGLIVGAVIILAAFYFAQHKVNTIPTKPLETKGLLVEKTDLEPAVVPSGFPQGLPVETGSKILQNYQATTPDGRKQSTRIATTNQTLAQALQGYEDFFIPLGWMMVNIPNQQLGTVSALFRKEDSVLLITAHTDTITKQSTVELTLTEVQPAK